MAKNIAGLLLIALLALTACGEKKKSDADLKIEKEKAWRERQRVQAIKYYGELVKTYPDSPHAAEARRRLEALGPVPTPAKK
jgi:TolA-binding protein